MSLVSSCSCLCSIYWSQVLSHEWRYSWSSADRRCFNYIGAVNIFIIKVWLILQIWQYFYFTVGLLVPVDALLSWRKTPGGLSLSYFSKEFQTTRFAPFTFCHDIYCTGMLFTHKAGWLWLHVLFCFSDQQIHWQTVSCFMDLLYRYCVGAWISNCAQRFTCMM